MTTLETARVVRLPVLLPELEARAVASTRSDAVEARGKFFFEGGRKQFVKGVTYGPFAVGSHGSPFPEPDRVDADFALMLDAGVNTVRVFTVPPLWLLDAAGASGLRVLVGLPWAQHVAFLTDAVTRAQVRQAVGDGVRACRRHPAIFGYLVGNEIPPDMIRWHGAGPVRRFLKGLVEQVRESHPGALVAYANFPSTEYLTVDFTDFLAFNVYLHDETAFRRYVARLQNLVVDKPLVLTEFGADSMRAGEEEQRRLLSWQVEAAFDSGVAGTFVFAWTDEWFTGGHAVENWAFGLVDAERRPKQAFGGIARRYGQALPMPLPVSPRVSVVVCAYNAERTLDPCLASLEALAYPDYEIILVNDGSTDRTLEIARSYRACRIISQSNRGLSVARNVGAEAATGDIVAYTDSDCVVDSDWLTYLVGRMQSGGLAACGGPNLPPPEGSLVPAAVAVSPGGPTHVLIDDQVAEHIAGCNMAFRRDVLVEIGGFDPVFRAAGDDVDICWRFQDAGHEIGFAAAAIVWHFRRNTVAAYLRQQRGYGRAEALVYAKHPQRFNRMGQAKWTGRIYGDLSAALLLSRKPLIYSGVFGRGLFQSLYASETSLARQLPLTFEWSLAALMSAALGVAAGGWLWLLALPLIATLALCANGAARAPIEPQFSGLQARSLVAVLIFLSPLLRGAARLAGRVRVSRLRTLSDIPRPRQRAHLVWSAAAFDLAYWSETGAEKERLLERLICVLPSSGYLVVPDSGWSDVDLDITGGIWSRASILVCVENHGGEKRLLRVRCTMRPSILARLSVGAWGTAAVVALLLGAPLAAAVAAVAGVTVIGAIGCRLVAAGRRLHRIVDDVADKTGIGLLAGYRRVVLAPAASPA